MSLKVALLGANGILGPSVLSALLSSSFTIFVLSRQSSKSIYDPSVNVIHVSDEPTLSEWTTALKGQDALICTIKGSYSELQMRLADAAAAAGVKVFVPADFGSCDSASDFACGALKLFELKRGVRRHLEKLAKENEAFTWTSLVTGHFFDYGLGCGLLGFRKEKGLAEVYDSGNYEWCTTTLGTIGMAVVKILEHPDEVRNRLLYIGGFTVTQNKLLETVVNVTGKKWTVKKMDSKKRIEELKVILEKNESDADAIEEMVGVVGIVEGDWRGKKGWANDLLGIQEPESLENVVKRVLKA